MSLPSAWVDSLFARLQVRYGSAWLRKWEGVDLEAVKADWSEELGGFASNPDAIKRALENLPADHPPTVTAFRTLCIGTPGDAYDKPKRLDAPSTSPEVIAAIKAVAKGPKPGYDPKAWAWRLRAREQDGDRIPVAHRAMWREALKAELAPEGETP